LFEVKKKKIDFIFFLRKEIRENGKDQGWMVHREGSLGIGDEELTSICVTDC